MSSETKKSKKFMVKPTLIWVGATVGVLVVLGSLIAGGVFAYTRTYADKIYPGVRVLGVRLDGLTKEEAKKQLDKTVDDALGKGLTFVLDGKQINVQVSSDSDLPDLIRFDLGSAIDQAYNVGRENSILQIVSEVLAARIYPKSVDVKIDIDENRVQNALKLQYADKLPDPVDASFSIEVKDGQSPVVRVLPEKDGATLDMDGVVEKIKQQAKVLSFQPITLHAKKINVQKRAADLSPLVDKALEILNRPQLVFTYQDKKYKISTATLAEWIAPDKADNTLTIDSLVFASSIRMLAEGVEAESKNGNLSVADGKIVSFSASTVGRTINIEKTLEPVLTSWPPTSTFPLVVDETKGEITGNDLEQYGIKELIGTGISDYGNSPPNRIKNIKKAVDERVNGTLIAPGKEFSMLKTLGPVDGEHGWYPELVIKGDKTTPEFGGGLCQIGTTMFRAALATGLPVTERRNHSYRVSYYEPAGTDATIYEPAPDFKFINDTGKYVLVNAYIKGTKVYFEMWGTGDGRKVAQTKPRIYNIVPAPPTKLTETEELAPGQKKCTESAHAGADAEFSTTVEYADGHKREETFSSHYRPWQAVCLIGVEKGTLTATSTAVTN
ncbi:MAG: VanW family protein [Patescibacteria group bacterium]|nr:VanW family protein [Patescibacteria group bacterium]